MYDTRSINQAIASNDRGQEHALIEHAQVKRWLYYNLYAMVFVILLSAETPGLVLTHRSHRMHWHPYKLVQCREGAAIRVLEYGTCATETSQIEG